MTNSKKRYYDVAIIICLCLIAEGIPFSLFIKDDIIATILGYLSKIAFIIFYFFYIKKHKLLSPKTDKLSTRSLLFIPFIVLAFSNFIYCWISKSSHTNEIVVKNIILSGINCILIATCEELTFRSLLAGEMNKDYKMFKTILLSSIIFGLIHLLNISSLSSIGIVWSQVVYSFVLGILASTIYLYSKNIILPIILHFLFNFINGTLVTNIYSYSWNIKYIIVSVIVGIIVLIYAFLVYYVLNKKEVNY